MEGSGVTEIHLHELRSRRHVLPLSGGEVVHHRHLVTPLEIRVDKVRADEPGAASYENLHSSSMTMRYVP
jgi:hypothetical protein